MSALPDDTSQTAGFTLIELSIVLVVIGLIVGGVLVGRDMIHAAELRSIITQATSYETAVNTFSEKYNCLPGDCPFATKFWPAADGSTGSTAACYSIDTTGSTATCNGNGNGSIDMADVANFGEEYRFWQHLSNAGLVPGGYSGYAAQTAGWGISITGKNIPQTRFQNVAFDVIGNRPLSYWNGGAPFYQWTSGPNFDVPSQDWTIGVATGTMYPAFFAGFTTSDAYSIDSKSDDGKPGTGKVRAQSPNICASTNDTGTASYILTNTAPAQCLIFWQFQ